MKNFTVAAVLALTLSACTMYGAPKAYMPSRDGLQAGQTITVKNNENIYAVARDHNVSMRELIVLNNLKPPYEVRPGQSLVLPASGSSFADNVMPPPQAAPLDTVEKLSLSPIEPAAVSSQSLSPIALAPPTPAPAATQASVQPQALTPQPAPVLAPPAIKTVTKSEPVRDLDRPSPPTLPTATTIAPPAAVTTFAPASAGSSEGIAMVWPVQGPIISSFGSKGAGLNNDGVNIGAPQGAPVVAAAPGTVVYAGNEMKGFGNLVLIRHEGDWVTAYAHLDRVLVKKDSIVGQGDMIGTVGKTGNVPSPQLHFETRHADKPVDPAGVIKDKG